MEQAQETEPQHHEYHHEAFARSHVTLGAAGHWIKTAGILAPLIIGEFVKDADKRWRYIRLASVCTALVSEGLYANRIQRERNECRERGGR